MEKIKKLLLKGLVNGYVTKADLEQLEKENLTADDIDNFFASCERMGIQYIEK